MKQQIVFPMITKDIENLPFIVTGIAMNYDEQGVERPEGYSDYQWAYCEAGEGVFEYKGEQYKITKGMAFFFQKNIPHRYYFVNGQWKIHWITFRGSSIMQVINYMDLKEVEVMNVRSEKKITHLLKEIILILQSALHDYEKSLLCSGKLYQLLIEVGVNQKNLQATERYKGYERLQPVVEYMNQNYQEIIALETLAEQIQVTTYYLCRLFKKTYQVKPIQYLNQIRIQKAKAYLLQENELKIKEIATLVGFQDKSYFALKFRTYEGCSPATFRKQYKATHLPQYNPHQ